MHFIVFVTIHFNNGLDISRKLLIGLEKVIHLNSFQLNRQTTDTKKYEKPEFYQVVVYIHITLRETHEPYYSMKVTT